MQAQFLEAEEMARSFLVDARRLMIIRGSSDSLVFFMKLVGKIEEDPLVPDIFLSFSHNFRVPADYTDAVVAQIEAQISSLNPQLTLTGQSPVPDLPPVVRDPNVTADERLWELVKALRAGIGPERPLLFIFCPFEQPLAEGRFSFLIENIIDRLEDNQVEGVKLMVRDTESHLLSRKYNDWSEATVYKPPLDRDSLFAGIMAQAESADASPDERAQAQMMAAGVDVANKRYDSALERNRIALDHYTTTGQRERQSIVLGSLGDLYYIQGQFGDAQTYYEQAIRVAVEEESHSLLIYQCINLGNALLMQKKNEEAIVYYRSSEQLAGAHRALPHQIRALEMIGTAQQQEGLTSEAIQTWEQAAQICRETQYKFGLMSVLDHLAQSYGLVSDDEKQAAANRELEQCRSALSEINPALSHSDGGLQPGLEGR
jgi:tetratricopeptide (TPR) repeat protein